MCTGPIFKVSFIFRSRYQKITRTNQKRSRVFSPTKTVFPGLFVLGLTGTVLYSTVQCVSSLHIIDARLQKSAKTSQIICRNNSSAFSLLRSSMTGIMSKTMIWSSCLSNQMKRYVMVDKTIARRCFASTPLTGVEREQALGTLAKGPMSWKQVSNQSPKMLYCSLFRLIFLEKSPL